MGKYSSLAADIIKNVGGKENVESLRHCVTRLRFRLIDESIANDEVIKNMDGVVTVMKAMGEYMVVIGEHVADVYDEVCSQLGLDAMQAENKEQKNAKKKSPLEKVLGTIMGGMGLTLHLLCACGIIKGLLVLLTFVGVKPTDGIYMLMNAAGDCFFYFLPLILGFNFAKKIPDRSILRTDPGSCNVLSGNSECRHQFMGICRKYDLYFYIPADFVWSSGSGSAV